MATSSIGSLTVGSENITGTTTFGSTFNVNGPATFAAPVTFATSTSFGGTASFITTSTPQLIAGYDSAATWSASTNASDSTVFQPSADSAGAFTFSTASGTPLLAVDTQDLALTNAGTASTTIGLAAQPFSGAYFGNVTLGSTLAPDANASLIFQRGAGNTNAQLQWNAGAGDLRYFTVNYPFNATYTLDSSSISTTANLYSGMLTNNATSGTQNLLSLTNAAGTGTTTNGIYLNNLGTGTTAIQIAGTWANGLVTNGNSINAGTGSLTAGSSSLASITASGNVR